MDRPCHAHSLVHRIPGEAAGTGPPHHPAIRLAALVTALAIAGAVLTATSSQASAASQATAASASDAAFRATPERAGRAFGVKRPSTMKRLLRAKRASGLEGSALTRRPVRPRARSNSEAGPRRGRASKREMPESARLDQRFARTLLRENGIGLSSTGRCSDRTVAICTSLKGVRWGTVKGVIGFAESSGCEITVTGGTERGHAGGPRSHAKGYKLDIAPGRCVDRAVERHPFDGVRGDGARLHRSPGGTVFAREEDHWDITFR
jgi:hypothetical protein